MLSELKNFDATRMDTEELVEIAALGRAYKAEFLALSVELPEWVEIQLDLIQKEVKRRNQDSIAMKIRTAKARLETLKTPDEKRAALSDEIKRLESLQTA